MKQVELNVNGSTLGDLVVRVATRYIARLIEEFGSSLEGDHVYTSLMGREYIVLSQRYVGQHEFPKM